VYATVTEIGDELEILGNNTGRVSGPKVVTEVPTDSGEFVYVMPSPMLSTLTR
jgi:hypothetical protein